jgi:predicted dehydrogenase
MHRRQFWMGASGVMFAAEGRITLGVIGAGGRGTYVMTEFQKDMALRIGAICDVYEPNLERALGVVRKAQTVPARAVRRYQELLADRSINAVLIATPEHWHHRMVLDALAAGKDVYVEKPLCQTPKQGVELVAAERASRQIVQVGMQRRSYDLYKQAREIVHSGTLGSVRMVRSWWLNNHVLGATDAPLEGKLDWEQWQGPAAKHAPELSRFRNWRLYADYAGGIVADQGAHVYDGIHMLMDASYPVAVTAAGGRPHRSGVDTPESVVVTAEYPEDFLGVFTINYAAMKYASKNDQLNQLDGSKARMDIGRETCRVYAAGKEEEVLLERRSVRGFGFATELHVRDFLECIRTRQRPAAPISLGFQAALVVQLANLSMEEGRRMRWNAKEWRVETA